MSSVVGMHRLLSLLVATALALIPAPVRALEARDSSDYGDTPAWCANFADLWPASVVINDRPVGLGSWFWLSPRRSARPPRNPVHGDRNHRPGGARLRVLLVPPRQQVECVLRLWAILDDPRRPVDSNPPQPGPVVLVMVDQDADSGVRGQVLQPLQLARSLWLRIDGKVEDVALHGEGDGHQVRLTVGTGRGQPSDRRVGEALSLRRGVHLRKYR